MVWVGRSYLLAGVAAAGYDGDAPDFEDCRVKKLVDRTA